MPFPGSIAAGKAGLVPGAKKGVRRWENGFEIHEQQMGDPHGKLARAGKKVEVRYVGKLANGKIFDQTKGKATFKFRLGELRWCWGVRDRHRVKEGKLCVGLLVPQP